MGPFLASAKRQAEALSAEAKRLAERAETATAEQKVEASNAARVAATKQKAALTNLEAASKRLKASTNRSQPKDIAEIIVSEPIAIRVKSGASK